MGLQIPTCVTMMPIVGVECAAFITGVLADAESKFFTYSGGGGLS